MVSAETNPMIKPEADKILEHHLATNPTIVAVEETVKRDDNIESNSEVQKVNAAQSPDSYDGYLMK